MTFFIVLHFVLALLIILLVLIQRSAESSVLVSSTHFAPSEASNLLVKVTRVCAILFVCNCLLMSYMKYGSHGSKKNVDVSTQTHNEVSVPVD